MNFAKLTRRWGKGLDLRETNFERQGTSMMTDIRKIPSMLIGRKYKHIHEIMGVGVFLWPLILVETVVHLPVSSLRKETAKPFGPMIGLTSKAHSFSNWRVL